MNKNVLIILGVVVIAVIGTILYLNKQSVDQGRQNNPNVIAPTPSIPNAVQQEVNIYFIALEDNGQSGKKIGCGDSLIPVKRTIHEDANSLQSALHELLSYKQQYFGESGLYNALYQSNLQIHEIEIENGVAKVELTGQVQLGGTCDSPRLVEQLEATVLQFPTITSVEILINDRPLAEVVSQQ